MSDQKLSQLTNITSLADTDELYVNDGGVSSAIDYSALRDRIREDEGAGGKLGLGGAGVFTSWELQVQNNGGTLRHYSYHRVGPGSVHFTGGVNGLESVWYNTPTGADASTAFVGGCKISSSDAAKFMLDTADLTGTRAFLDGLLTAQDIGQTDLNVRMRYVSLDVNGVTRLRPWIELTNSTGTRLAWDTNNFASGKSVTIVLQGFLPSYS